MRSLYATVIPMQSCNHKFDAPMLLAQGGIPKVVPGDADANFLEDDFDN